MCGCGHTWGCGHVFKQVFKCVRGHIGGGGGEDIYTLRGGMNIGVWLFTVSVAVVRTHAHYMGSGRTLLSALLVDIFF